MKYNYIYTLIFIFSTFFSFIKSGESSYPLLDIDLNNIDDNTLKSFQDFEFSKDKQDTINIKQKMKKIACMNIITTVIKESNSEIKHQLKSAKSQNKNNFNIFINNMTETCIKIIKEKDIKQILNIENFEKKNFPLGKKEIKFEEHLSQFLEENERYKKMEEMEIYRQKRNKMIINSILIGTIVFIIFLIWNFGRKKKGNDNDDKKAKNEKKSGHKKKGKKVDNKENKEN
jgi:hypothetical protein